MELNSAKKKDEVHSFQWVLAAKYISGAEDRYQLLKQPEFLCALRLLNQLMESNLDQGTGYLACYH